MTNLLQIRHNQGIYKEKGWEITVALHYYEMQQTLVKIRQDM